jgi:hypothetical protein
MIGYYLLSGILFLIGMAVSSTLKRKFQEYGEMPLSEGLSGKEVAEKMLRDNNIHDVRVISADGFLSDHYNPTDKTVNLSPDVYSGRSISAAAVAAHECGHAVQHKVAYAPLKMRSALVPVVQVCSNILNIFNMGMLFIGGFIFYNQGIVSTTLLTILVVANLGVTLFSLITLPVEFDASRRALAWVEQRGIVNRNEHAMAKDALKWAALTYVVAALGALANLMYYASLLLGRRSDD